MAAGLRPGDCPPLPCCELIGLQALLLWPEPAFRGALALPFLSPADIKPGLPFPCALCCLLGNQTRKKPPLLQFRK